MQKKDVFKEFTLKPDNPALPMIVTIAGIADRADTFKQDAMYTVVEFVEMESALTLGWDRFDEFVEATGQEDTDDWTNCPVYLFSKMTQTKRGKQLVIHVRKPDTKAKGQTLSTHKESSHV